MSLKDYARKRDFTQTSEPRGGKAPKPKGLSRFVIQKHAASRLHYDFRLEVDGTLKSWAVPKGLPYAKGEKHLAVHVEDHPVEYVNFEGIIPKGEYGGGTVMVWDTGTYEPLSENPAADLKKGKLHFILHGEKLKGEWALIEMHGRDENAWLIFKAGENTRPLSAKRDDQSVLSGRTMAQIAAEKTDTWHSKASAAKDTLEFIEPMKAKLVTAPPKDEAWVYEIKFDGYRILALKEGGRARLLSRNNKDLTARFSQIADAVAELAVKKAIFDGEIVALDDEGRPSFQLLQDSENNGAPLAYYLFDVLQEGERSLRARPLAKRKERLTKILAGASEPLRLSADLQGEPEELLAKAREFGFEGLIGKLADSEYEVGRRSGAWIKLKLHNEQEFVIGGFTPPQGTRAHFGALLVGYFEEKSLKFAGKVGTGFDEKLLRVLHQRMKAFPSKKCPFSNLPEKKSGRWSQNLTPAEMRRCEWVEPRLVCEVKFTEWTDDGKLRHPVFLGLREDKAPAEVVREQPLPEPAAKPRAAAARSRAKR